MKSLPLTLLFLFSVLCAAAQRPVGFAYYDAYRLYDTIPALFYDDSDFTPKGRMHWTSERYHRKITHTAALIDSMRMDIVALSGVETEEVVRDLTAACTEDYCYFHRTLNGFDGLDIALLYHADRFHPHYAQEGRGWLFVKGELDGTAVGLLICRNGRYAAEALADCRENHPGLPLIAAGRFYTSEGTRHGLNDALLRAERAGRGSIRYSNGWRMSDRILADTVLHTAQGDVFIRHWLTDTRTGAPLPTYDRTTYRGGWGRSLPVFVYLGLP